MVSIIFEKTDSMRKVILISFILFFCYSITLGQKYNDSLSWNNGVAPMDMYKFPVVFVKGYFSLDTTFSEYDLNLKQKRTIKKANKKLEKICVKWLCVDQSSLDTMDWEKYPYIITMSLVEIKNYNPGSEVTYYVPKLKIYDRNDDMTYKLGPVGNELPLWYDQGEEKVYGLEDYLDEINIIIENQKRDNSNQ